MPLYYYETRKGRRAVVLGSSKDQTQKELEAEYGKDFKFIRLATVKDVS